MIFADIMYIRPRIVLYSSLTHVTGTNKHYCIDTTSLSYNMAHGLNNGEYKNIG